MEHSTAGQDIEVRNEHEGEGESDAKRRMLQSLLKAHEAWFDVREGYEYAGRAFAGYAEFHSHGEQYVLVKRAKLWEVDAHEYVFFHLADHFDGRQLSELISFMQLEAIKKVVPEPNHMSSCLSLVVIADDADDDALRLVRTTRFRKNFAFGFRGWADLRLAVVSLARASVTTNAAGKALRPMIEANAGLPRQGKR